jgi:methylated-DNA-[protein]-cysteine S-methyltransferase
VREPSRALSSNPDDVVQRVLIRRARRARTLYISGVRASSEELSRRAWATPLGRLSLVGSDAGLREVFWDDDADESCGGGSGSDLLEEAERQLRSYFSGVRRCFDLPLDLVGTAFQLAAWHALADIPFGTTISYGEQARRLGRSHAARAVGSANGRNPLAVVLPCHRLTGADGSLVGYGGGIARKRMLLEHEARVVAGGRARGG